MWIIDVAGPKPATGGNPPWVRFRRMPGELSEAEIEEVIRAMATEHTAVRAMKEGVEIEVRRQYSVTVRRVGTVVESETV